MRSKTENASYDFRLCRGVIKVGKFIKNTTRLSGLCFPRDHGVYRFGQVRCQMTFPGYRALAPDVSTQQTRYYPTILSPTLSLIALPDVQELHWYLLLTEFFLAPNNPTPSYFITLDSTLVFRGPFWPAVTVQISTCIRANTHIDHIKFPTYGQQWNWGGALWGSKKAMHEIYLKVRGVASWKLSQSQTLT